MPTRLRFTTDGARTKPSVAVLRVIGLAAAVAWAGGCDPGIDTTREAGPKATLGDDIYGVLCDRVGASSLVEDLTGASYQAVCHYNAKGKYKDEVDTSVLPPVSGKTAKTARQEAIAKVEAMARHRADLVHAFNSIFPDVKIDDPTSKSGGQVRLHDALMSLGQTIAPLYESNPYDEKGEPLLPSSTRALGRLFDALAKSDPARQALASVWGRKGYRPFRVGLGAIRPALAYPALRDLTKASLEVLGPDGTAVPELQQLLTVTKNELLTSKPVVQPLPSYSVDPATAQPNRPRSAIEVTAALMLTEDPSFAADVEETPRYISLRDKRGFVVPVGNQPGVPGTVVAPFTDTDGDGFADVDAFGRFVDGSGAPLAIDPPFAIPGVAPLAQLDPWSRPATPLYEYVDTSRVLTGSLGRNMIPLLDATKYASDGDPAAYASEHESLMYAMAGAYTLFGDREAAAWDYSTDTMAPAGQTSCATCVPYQRFKAEESPIPDLVHAAGQVLADPDSDAILLSFIDLLENHEDVMARLVGAALRVKEIADEHDAAAQQGKEPLAELPYETPIWDEFGQLVARITAVPGLTTKLVNALADDRNVTPYGGSQHLGATLATLMGNRDKLTYNNVNPGEVNGPSINETDGAPSTSDPHHAVDRTKPDNGDNRSCFERSLQIIHDADRVKACNKGDAHVYLGSVFGSDAYWPLVGAGYAECDLFSFENLATYYLDSLLPANHPKRSELKIKSNTLNDMMSFIGVNNADKLLENSSGITGLTLHPTPQALNRLVFFGADSDEYLNMPDHDFINEGSNTNKFVHASIEPVAPAVCPKKPDGVRHCSSQDDVLRLRGHGTIFLWERLGFYQYLQPMVEAFASVSCADDLSYCDTSDDSGEQMFVDAIETLWRHWPTKDHGPECNKTGNASSNPKYCSEAGVSRYEPILVDAFQSDLIPALHAFAKTVSEASSITIQRGPKAGQKLTGAEVLELVTKILFDPVYAKSVGMVDRNGNASTTWVDGTPQPQVTVFSLFADALHRMDTRFDAAPDGADRKAQWKRARSQLVDQFLAVEGTGTDAHFKNPGTAKTLAAVLRVVREQLNAHCPSRETGEACTWAKKDLADELSRTISGPVFAAIMDLQEKVRQDEPARRELEKFLSYLLAASSDGDALQATLASMNDLMQVMSDDGVMSPIFNAIANAANPDGDDQGPGAADTAIKVLKALTSDKYDKYHVVDHVLPALVTPMDGGNGPTPVEVILDTIADVNRVDAASQDPLGPDDYKYIMKTVDGFLTDKTRGLEQLYTIVQNRRRE